jgi:uncharacterized protein (TIGR00299 family) protein
MHLHLNPLGGLAGDMFCAALLDARPDLLARVRETVACLGMPREVHIELRDAGGVIKGKRFELTPARQAHHQPHMAFRDILKLLESAQLTPEVHQRSVHIFTLLAEAEGRVHGIAPKEVSFHEVGNWDSIADIVSAAALLDALDVRSASCAPLPLGGGRIKTAHDILPVPAPATVLLLEDLPVIDDGISGERVTPTGAAIVKSMQPTPAMRDGGMLHTSGMGFGTRALPGIPNCLQVLCIETSTTPTHPETDRVAILGFEVDDQSPEDFALAMDHLRATEGVLSVTSFQGIGKGGRPTMSVEILARPTELTRVADACFRETTTIGLRWGESFRYILPRRLDEVQIGRDKLRVKVVDRPQGSTAKIEAGDVGATPSHAERERLRRLGAALALAQESDLD